MLPTSIAGFNPHTLHSTNVPIAHEISQLSASARVYNAIA